jgi:hypothetical protein
VRTAGRLSPGGEGGSVSLSVQDIPRLRDAAQRLHELVLRLRSKAANAEGLVGPVQALGDGSTWQGAYAGQVGATMTTWSGGLRRDSDNLRDRAGFLQTVADGYEATADALARVQTKAGG